MKRISPEDIRKKGQVPKNARLFSPIFQTFMSVRKRVATLAVFRRVSARFLRFHRHRRVPSWWCER